MDHLFNLYSFTSTLWKWVAYIFNQTVRNKNDVTETLKNWRKYFSNNETFNLAQTLILGFLIWDVWKERNNRIFKAKSSSTQRIMAQILKQLKETVNALLKKPPEKPLGQRDAHILELLGLQSHVLQGLKMKARHISERQAFWQPPPHGFLKFNIDGASKGNPRDVGYQGVIRDEESNIKVIFHSHLGRETNNMAELMAIEQGIDILIDHNLHNAIIEADSELKINSVKRISIGTTPDKVSNHWRLSQVYHRIQSHLRILRTLSFVHVHRDANGVAEQLANEGVLCTRDNKCCSWKLVPAGQLREDCYTLDHADKEHYQYMKGKQPVEN